MKKKYDTILIPSGGITEQGFPLEWTKRRLDEALNTQQGEEYFITMSAGTTHKPRPLDKEGFPIFEAEAMAVYLVSNGINPRRILPEVASYDTIGNAYFSRVIHVQPRHFTNLLVITSQFHMPRTKEIFQWIYNLLPEESYELDFKEVTDEGLENMLAARIEKEKKSLEKWIETEKQIRTLAELHNWLYTEHGAYAVAVLPKRENGDILRTY